MRRRNRRRDPGAMTVDRSPETYRPRSYPSFCPFSRPGCFHRFCDLPGLWRLPQNVRSLSFLALLLLMLRTLSEKQNGRDFFISQQSRSPRAGEDVHVSLPLVSKREIQPGGQDNVIRFERKSACWLCRWVGYVDIAERILPGQPLADLRHRTEIEGRTILPRCVGEVGEEVQL